MLESTFLHLPGVGAKTERDLWKRGIRSWDTYEESQSTQISLFGTDERDRRLAVLEESRAALAKGDTDYFASRLPKSEHYRIALTFPDDTCFLDIETTGLSHYYDEITVVGFSYADEYFCHVIGTDRKEFLRKISKAKCLVTFNGTLFDTKFLKRDFPDLRLPIAHVDLRFFARSLGLRGGQKKVEAEIGVVRASEIADVVGEAAPLLWHEYRMGSREAATRLIGVNIGDKTGHDVGAKASQLRLI